MKQGKIYVNFESAAHFICSLNLNSPELTIFITYKLTDIASENQSFFNPIAYGIL